MQVRENAIFPLTPDADHTGLEGYFVTADGALMADGTTEPFGLILVGNATTGKDALAICSGGFSGTAKVKLAATPGTVNPGTFLVLDGTTLGAVKADSGSGARVQVAQALESGAAGELIEAVLVRPATLS